MKTSSAEYITELSTNQHVCRKSTQMMNTQAFQIYHYRSAVTPLIMLCLPPYLEVVDSERTSSSIPPVPLPRGVVPVSGFCNFLQQCVCVCVCVECVRACVECVRVCVCVCVEPRAILAEQHATRSSPLSSGSPHPTFLKV